MLRAPAAWPRSGAGEKRLPHFSRRSHRHEAGGETRKSFFGWALSGAQETTQEPRRSVYSGLVVRVATPRRMLPIPPMLPRLMRVALFCQIRASGDHANFAPYGQIRDSMYPTLFPENLYRYLTSCLA